MPLQRMLRNWFTHRYLRKLGEFDDYILSDSSLTRGDLHHGQSLPYDVDPMGELLWLSGRRVPKVQRHK